MDKKIVAGIVTYNPDIELLRRNIDAIIYQVNEIVIIDNASENIDEIRALTNDLLVRCIRNTHNLGIAGALNTIFSEYQQKGYDYILTLDQDSVCPSHMIEHFKKFMDETIAIICPQICDINRKNKKLYNTENAFVKRCITSGALTSIKAWNTIHGFDEKIFIDGVDFDFCDRLIKYGYKILQINSVTMEHAIGFTQERKILFFKVIVRNHSPFRKYYIAKNIVYLDRKNGCKTYPVSTVLRVLKQIFLVILFEKDKFHKIKQLLKGMYKGFTEKLEHTI